MNPGRGWNPDLEESYLLEYREYEDEPWIICTSGFHIRPMKVLALDTSQNLSVLVFRVFPARAQPRV